MKRGLVLEGGGMRGLFTAGVLDVLMERGVKFDGIVGVSAGACFGCNYKSGQIGRVIRYNKRFARDPRYCSWKSLFTTGDLFGAEFCYRTLPMELDVFDAAAYEANPMEFHDKPFLRRYPAVYKALKTRHEWYNETLKYIDSRVAAGAALLIAPDASLDISRVCHDPDTMQRVYDIGRRKAEAITATGSKSAALEVPCTREK